MNGKGLLTNEEKPNLFLKDIIQAVKSEKLDDDFCLYAKENGELNFQDSYLPCRYIWQ